jgi:exoribonuclease II
MLTPEQRRDLIEQLRAFPVQLEALVKPLDDEQLATRYLDGEWSVAQIVHHVLDSHINGYIRMKLMATEENPTLKTYQQQAWAEMADVFHTPVSVSLVMLNGLHQRWAIWLGSLHDADWQRVGMHPDEGEMTMNAMLQKYIGHGENHINHIHKTLAAQPA